MTRAEYENKRTALMNEAKSLIDEGRIEEANSKMNEVTGLDEEYEKTAKAMASMKALQNPPAPLTGYGEGTGFGGIHDKADNVYDSTEYRTAFMNYVLSGVAIPEKFRNASAVTKTSDVGAVISPAVLNRIVEKMESSGMILPMVTKTAFAAGVTVPTSSVKPVATWVAEGGTSDKQKRRSVRLTSRVTNCVAQLRCRWKFL